VLRLATDLRESGIDVILDKWDLKEGHDANAFMERMVADDTIQKVVMVCDRLYVEKANNRTGGVGTETQIITPDI
jgi:TIR domain